MSNRAVGYATHPGGQTNTATDLAKAFRRFERALADLEVKVSDETLRAAVDASNECRALHDVVFLRAMTRARKNIKFEEIR